MPVRTPAGGCPLRPSRPIWIAWSLALVGGLAVLIAAVLVLDDPCADGGPCTSTSVSVATALAVTGTVVAVIAGLVATWLTVRGSEGDRGPT